MLNLAVNTRAPTGFQQCCCQCLFPDHHSLSTEPSHMHFTHSHPVNRRPLPLALKTRTYSMVDILFIAECRQQIVLYASSEIRFCTLLKKLLTARFLCYVNVRHCNWFQHPNRIAVFVSFFFGTCAKSLHFLVSVECNYASCDFPPPLRPHHARSLSCVT